VVGRRVAEEATTNRAVAVIRISVAAVSANILPFTIPHWLKTRSLYFFAKEAKLRFSQDIFKPEKAQTGLQTFLKLVFQICSYFQVAADSYKMTKCPQYSLEICRRTQFKQTWTTFSKGAG
jgi:hypothetical protein